MAEQERHVRIKPSNNRQTHGAHGVTIRKSDGWVIVPLAIAAKLAQEPMNELNPDASPRVFDVCTAAEAKQMDRAERKIVSPAGTVSKPRRIAADGSAEADAPGEEEVEEEEEEEEAPAPAPRAAKGGKPRRG